MLLRALAVLSILVMALLPLAGCTPNADAPPSGGDGGSMNTTDN